MSAISGVYYASPTTLGNGEKREPNLDSTGNQRMVMTGNLQTGPSNNNNSLVYAYRDSSPANWGYTATVGGFYNGSGCDVARKPSSTSRIVSAAASTNATSAKASSGDLFSIIATNTTAALKYLKLYNKASAPTVGTDTPVLTIALQPSNVPTVVRFATGMYFSTGIAYALTGAAADADTTALVAGDVVGVNIVYQ